MRHIKIFSGVLDGNGEIHSVSIDRDMPDVPVQQGWPTPDPTLAAFHEPKGIVSCSVDLSAEDVSAIRNNYDYFIESDSEEL